MTRLNAVGAALMRPGQPTSYYLNNFGTRLRTPGQRCLVKDHGITLGVYAVDSEEAVGNFSAFRFRVKGVSYGAMPESFRDEATGLAVCEIEGARVYGRMPRVSRFVLMATLASLTTDMHSGGASRGYRLQCMAYRWLRKRGHMSPPESAVNRQLYAKLAAKYGDGPDRSRKVYGYSKLRYAPFAERVREGL